MKKNEDKENITIYIDKKIKQELKEEARKMDVPLNSLIKMKLKLSKEKEVKDGT
jgi:hypothetical protein